MKMEKPITFIFLYAFENYKNNNFNKILNELREVLIYNNNFFEEINEIEPEDLIDFLIKKLHLENNRIASPDSKIYKNGDDFDILNDQKIFEKYNDNFVNFFKSNITTIKACLNCNKLRDYFESFYYLKLDANEVNKYFSNSNNFILDVLKKESENYVQIKLFCPNCKIDCMHKINKKILKISSNLIISLKSEEIDFNNQNLKYPLTLNLDNFGAGTYILKGVVKKSIIKGKTCFLSLYKEMNEWSLSDGIKIEKLNCFSPLNHNIGNVILLFYSNEN
jgi:hypothetical protein